MMEESSACRSLARSESSPEYSDKICVISGAGLDHFLLTYLTYFSAVSRLRVSATIAKWRNSEVLVLAHIEAWYHLVWQMREVRVKAFFSL